ncbi:hypothetical protein [Natroniella acetigena]|nr:hypothetical protein [Natroniella acetigena]
MQNMESNHLINEGSLIMFDKQLAEEVGMMRQYFYNNFIIGLE